jgi:hypothetical protein
MHDRQELHDTIVSLYPDITAHNMDVTVSYDKEKASWVVDLKKDDHYLKHYLGVPDADTCMDGKQCVSLGLEIAQLKKNLAGKQF